jgi:plasmid rolling circle replication initiator protein Rep
MQTPSLNQVLFPLNFHVLPLPDKMSDFRTAAVPVPKTAGSLDTLAQLSQVATQTEELHKKRNNVKPKDTLLKRARAKALTDIMAGKLKMLDSPLQKAYTNTLFCSSELVQVGNMIKSKYCKNRWCVVCNRIRTANLINGYMPALKKIEDKFFVTLTVPNVPGVELKRTIKLMLHNFKNLRKDFHRRKTKITGLRKLECTYNPARDDFHPHFHLIVQGEQTAKDVIDSWLDIYTLASRSAQDMRAADNNSALEMFKYFTKLIGYDKKKKQLSFDAQSVDTIFRSIKNVRIFQPIGIKKMKHVTEEIEEIQTQVYEGLPETMGRIFWRWQPESTDWCDEETGQLLTGYTINDRLLKMFSG